MIELKLPEIGENIEGGDIVRILVQVGDRIDKDQTIVELETDKATVEVPASASGVVQEILVKEGDNVAVGQVIVKIADGQSGEDKRPQGKQIGEKAEKPAPRESKAAPGDPRSDDEKAPEQGDGKKETETAQPEEGGEPIDQERLFEEVAHGTVIAASPSVRRFARESGVDIRGVPGSGPQGRISLEDVKRSRLSPQAVVPLPDFSKWGESEERPFSNVRRATVRQMTQAWTQIPHVTQHDAADITDLEVLRKKYGPRVEAQGGKLTVTAIALRVAAAALRRFPQFNASIDPARGVVILKHYVHIGVAVDTDRGLLVPVIRDVDSKNIGQLSVELSRAAAKARDRKLGIEDLQGGTFTITNLGGIGGTSFAPIVNWPEVAILGISRAEVRAVFRDGAFVPRTMMPLSLSYDHRVIDGADGARFLRWVAEAFENPFLLSLEG